MEYDQDLLNLRERKLLSLEQVEYLINTIQYARNWARRVTGDELIDPGEVLQILTLRPQMSQLEKAEYDALLDVFKGDSQGVKHARVGCGVPEWEEEYKASKEGDK